MCTGKKNHVSVLHTLLAVSAEAKESSVTIDTPVSTSPHYEPADRKLKSMVKLQHEEVINNMVLPWAGLAESPSAVADPVADHWLSNYD